jgi:hypothetical protein
MAVHLLRRIVCTAAVKIHIGAEAVHEVGGAALRGQRGEVAGAVAEGVAAASIKIEKINGGKGDDDSSETEPKHISNIVPGHALPSFHFG